MQVEVVVDEACHCGENPLWHPQEKQLYWTDIPTGRLFRYDPASGSHEQIYEGRPVGGFTFEPDGSLVLFRDRGNVVLWREGQEVRTLVEEIAEERETRFNDVMADPEGRVFAGTMPTAERNGRLYRMDRDGSYRVVMEDVDIANGMGFTPEGGGLYFTESRARTIWLFDYDRASGELANRRPAVRTPEGEGVPDGMVVDTAGHIWSARFGGGGIYRYSGDGELLGKIQTPAPKMTSLIFAGEGLDQVYATSAGGEKKDEDGPHAGALFRIAEPGAQGQAEAFSRLGS